MYLGSSEVDTFKLGADDVDKIYLGNTEVWSNTASPGTEVFTVSGTFTPKSGWTEYTVEVLGGGGGGGGNQCGVLYGKSGDGGNTALLDSDVLTVTSPTLVTVAVSVGTDTNGADSSFMSLNSTGGLLGSMVEVTRVGKTQFGERVV